jgi:guanylate kinase
MNELNHLTEFQNILKAYSISDASKLILKETKMMLFAAATSAGRNTIIKELLKTDRYHYMVSDTTRKPRVNDGVPEKDGVEYWFKTEEEMLENLQKGKLLEAAIIHNQQVSGISIDELEKAKNEGKIAITDIEVVGVRNIVHAKPDATCLFIIPPTFEEWLHRLEHRGAMDEKETRRRLESAAMEFELALSEPYYWIVVNDQLSEAVRYINNLATGVSRSSDERQTKNRQTLEKLLEETRAYLSKG